MPAQPAYADTRNQKIGGIVSPDGSVLQIRKPNMRGALRLVGNVAPAVAGAAIWTSHVKVESEGEFDAVRIIIGSREAGASANWKFAVAATSTAETTSTARLFDPTEDGVTFSTTLAAAGGVKGWRAGTFAGAAVGTVPGGASMLPAYLVSDWVPCRSVARTDVPGLGRHLAMIRLYHNGTADGAHSTVSGFQPSGGWADQAAQPYHRVWQHGLTVGSDAVAALATKPGALTGSGFWVGVEFHYRNAMQARTLLVCGDSIDECNGTQLPGNIYGGYAMRACALASTPDDPIGFINAGMSSQTGATYTAAALAAIAAFKPTDVLYAGFSVNDGAGDVFLCDTMMMRTLQVLDACKEAGARLFVRTGVPNEGWTLAQDNARKDYNRRIRALADAGAVTLVDYATAVGDGASPERYRAGLKFDNIHPGDAGMDEGAAVLADALRATW